MKAAIGSKRLDPTASHRCATRQRQCAWWQAHAAHSAVDGATKSTPRIQPADESAALR
ncbi:hypothetical protein [Xanthomonas rydalmerensis]|uniref:Uncharacterized protein n=1 Tax=Xanthomonas rydalmerensis TaxID=3046274 RepID=A0ABZ0JNF9_9XANT|nr:hypothetical protein [Xanthomonas sp. DM-2023]WOS41195.1 hypothetical protein QN243_01540 [Xanthomonas sp. DM-2023]WOS45380.1 hypothetical protein QN242_01540 [Xanthomonas sp. DM-2023]WOS49559.1 hypothetical protein QN240_01540 [Xanthomonas sp. DM-2023]WOS53739.1 hypothetical protein QN244_01540 [Xanthomonas sp. DM-2023]WOS57922.1 hypothetical protein QN245_01540 [Xanthomonas sp. DM-2023]